MLKVYIAHAMTGRTGAELLKETEIVHLEAEILELTAGAKITLLDPVVAEGVTADDERLANPDDKLAVYWRRDKAMIREAHVLIDLTGPAKSEGVAHEIGYARFGLWKPVLRVWPKLGPSVARFEDDVIAENSFLALAEAYRRWGTRKQRVLWRLNMLRRSLGKWLKYQLTEAWA